MRSTSRFSAGRFFVERNSRARARVRFACHATPSGMADAGADGDVGDVFDVRLSPPPPPLRRSRRLPQDPPAPSDYVFRDGLRFTVPYMFDYFAHVKTRWQGTGLVDLFCREFKGRSREYYEAAVAAGRLRVEETSMSKRSGKRKAEEEAAAPDESEAEALARRARLACCAPLRDGQRVRHLVHRHEPPVLDVPLPILATTEDTLVLCKPASMPVHPTGQYRKNSVLGIFASQHGLAYGRLCPVHRLDRNVSGLLLFARGPGAADALRIQIQAGSVCKEYVARVRGSFPAHSASGEAVIVVDAPLRYDYPLRRSVVDAEPGKGAKSAATAMRLLAVSVDGGESLVAVRPLTGRTHQIRAHLEHAGFPIVNDVLYGGALAADAPAPGAQPPGGRHEGEPDPLCTHCPWLAPQGQDHDVEALFLHACRYGGSGGGEGGGPWQFEAPLPEWAAELMPGGGSALPAGLWDGVSEETLKRYHDTS